MNYRGAKKIKKVLDNLEHYEIMRAQQQQEGCSMTVQERLQLRLDIYFSLTRKQQRRFSELGGSHTMLECFNEWDKVTKSKKILEQVATLKGSCIRLVA
jgi:hypothetical protein